MSLKQEIETWVAALSAYDNNEFDAALRCFETIADTSKILFNTGVIHATLGQHAAAVDCYQRAIQLDQYLAVAYFQQGVSNFLVGDFEEALANFNDTLLYLRGHKYIDYDQLGLKFKLFSCEVLFNRGLCYIYLQQKDAGMQDLAFAAKEKSVMDHDVIDEAIREQAEGYTVFSIPVGVVYRPNEAKVRNLKTRDFLGKAKLIASHNQTHVDPRRQAALAALAIDDRPGESLSYAALNLVKPDLRSRARQQSEPPMNRNMFPPTPPPEPERPISHRSTESSTSAGSSLQHSRLHAKPLRLELGAAAFDQSRSVEKVRQAPRRSESERPNARNDGPHMRSTSSRHRQDQYANVPEIYVAEDPLPAYSDQTAVRPHSQRTRGSNHHMSNHAPILEEPEDPHRNSDESSEGQLSDHALAFEIVAPNPPRSSTSTRSRGQVRRAPEPELRRIRVKVHGQDMRYVMVTPTTTYQELEALIQKKFGLHADFKLKIRDEEGDMVTIADQDDLDMAFSICKATAAQEKAEMGKLEIWVQELLL